MISTYTESQQAFRAMVRDFAEKEVAPGAEERDRSGQFDNKLYKRLGELGVIGINFPKEFGGGGGDFLSMCLSLEELARVDASMASVMHVAQGPPTEIVLFANDEQKARWKDKYVLPVVMGEGLASPAGTEPQAGSDTSAWSTYATLEGDEWVINGRKALITNAGLDISLFANTVVLTDRDNREFSTILVPTGTPGYAVTERYRTAGQRAVDVRDLIFKDCRVPAGNVLGERGSGRSRAVGWLYVGARIKISSIALGIHQACVDAAIKYAQERIAFKRPISKFQYVQGMLVDMYTDLQAGRLIRDRAAAIFDESADVPTLEASVVKYFCSEAAMRAADNAVRIHGGLGVVENTPASRFNRDVRQCIIGDGTTEIQKWIISRELGC